MVADGEKDYLFYDNPVGSIRTADVYISKSNVAAYPVKVTAT